MVLSARGAVVLAAPALVELLLNTSPVVVQCVPAQADDVDGIHDRDRARQSLTGRGLESGEPVHRDHFDTVLPALGAAFEPGFERRFGAARDYVQQPRWAGLVPGWVRSMITVTCLSPRRAWRQTCSSAPITRTASKRAGPRSAAAGPPKGRRRWRCARPPRGRQRSLRS